MYYTSSNAYSTTGVKNISLPFTPTGMRVTLGQKFGSDTTVEHQSVGTADGTRQNFVSTYGDSSGHQTKQDNTAVASHYERVSGTLTEVCAATFSSFSTNQAAINISKTNANYTWILEFWD